MNATIPVSRSYYIRLFLSNKFKPCAMSKCMPKMVFVYSYLIYGRIFTIFRRVWFVKVKNMFQSNAFGRNTCNNANMRVFRKVRAKPTFSLPNSFEIIRKHFYSNVSKYLANMLRIFHYVSCKFQWSRMPT